MAGYLGPKAIQYNVDNSVVHGDSSVGGDLTVGGTINVANGITFGSGTDVLDDYEEGTWTPVLKFGGATTGITYTNQGGTYTKIGDTVNIRCYTLLSNKGTATGNCSFHGLPFNVASGNENYAGVSMHLNEVNFSGFPNAWCVTNSDRITMAQITDAGTNSIMTTTNFSNTSGIIFGATYRTTS